MRGSIVGITLWLLTPPARDGEDSGMEAPANPTNLGLAKMQGALPQLSLRCVIMVASLSIQQDRRHGNTLV